MENVTTLIYDFNMTNCEKNYKNVILTDGQVFRDTTPGVKEFNAFYKCGRDSMVEYNEFVGCDYYHCDDLYYFSEIPTIFNFYHCTNLEYLPHQAKYLRFVGCHDLWHVQTEETYLILEDCYGIPDIDEKIPNVTYVKNYFDPSFNDIRFVNTENTTWVKYENTHYRIHKDHNSIVVNPQRPVKGLQNINKVVILNADMVKGHGELIKSIYRGLPDNCKLSLKNSDVFPEYIKEYCAAAFLQPWLEMNNK